MSQSNNEFHISKERLSLTPSAAWKMRRSFAKSSRISTNSTLHVASHKSLPTSTEIPIVDCLAREPGVCVLCGSGITSTKCAICGTEGHNRCIEAFYCTSFKPWDFEDWRCPKCVATTGLEKASFQHDPNTSPKRCSLELYRYVPPIFADAPQKDPNCPFCKIEMEAKKCKCRVCFDDRLALDDAAAIAKAQANLYNKCLKYRDLSRIEFDRISERLSKMDEENEQEEEDLDEDINDEKEAHYWEKRRRSSIITSKKHSLCWSILWFLLLITFAFPVAIICSPIYILLHCYEICCFNLCHSIAIFFLEGIKLPGSCCKGIATGEPMCIEDTRELKKKSNSADSRRSNLNVL